MTTTGKRDTQTALPRGRRLLTPIISGLKIIELGNILTRSGYVNEVFRTDLPGIEVVPQQVTWVQLNPNGVTDWHRHMKQTDHLVGVGGPIKLALRDGRANSPTLDAVDLVRMGALSPVMVVVPPGVWHALRNESGVPAGYLNFTDQLMTTATRIAGDYPPARKVLGTFCEFRQLDFWSEVLPYAAD